MHRDVGEILSLKQARVKLINRFPWMWLAKAAAHVSRLGQRICTVHSPRQAWIQTTDAAGIDERPVPAISVCRTQIKQLTYRQHFFQSLQDFPIQIR